MASDSKTVDLNDAYQVVDTSHSVPFTFFHAFSSSPLVSFLAFNTRKVCWYHYISHDLSVFHSCISQFILRCSHILSITSATCSDNPLITWSSAFAFCFSWAAAIWCCGTITTSSWIEVFTYYPITVVIEFTVTGRIRIKNRLCFALWTEVGARTIRAVWLISGAGCQHNE